MTWRTAVRQLKEEPGDGLAVGGLTLPLALADLGLIDEYEFVVQPILAGPRTDVVRRPARAARPAAREPPGASSQGQWPCATSPARDACWCRRRETRSAPRKNTQVAGDEELVRFPMRTVVTLPPRRVA